MPLKSRSSPPAPISNYRNPSLKPPLPTADFHRDSHSCYILGEEIFSARAFDRSFEDGVER